MSQLKYRADIDGLRAVAVISVIFFHFGISGFSGGYVGVDVFFVISGYLITKIIHQQMMTNSFSFKEFYIRRMRRIFPALVMTILLTSIVGALILSPEHFVHLANSSVSALFSISNIYFWSGSGYFDVGSELKPLLHTWSLSVEEQYYLLWPVLFLLLIKIDKAHFVKPAMILLLFLSLFLGQYFVVDNKSLVFFWMPFRFNELAIGAMLIFISTSFKKQIYHDVLFLFGLFLIISSVVFYDEKMNFPGFSALVPCVGAFFVIFSGKQSRLSFLLANKVMVFIGLISYSLYLIHWPVYVFSSYLLDVLSFSEKMILLFFSLILSFFFYKFVETPFRQKQTKNIIIYELLNTGLGFSVMFLSALLISVAVILGKGWQWRLDDEISVLLNNTEEFKITNRLGSCYLGQKTSGYKLQENCYQLKSKKKKQVLLLGSSHSADLYPGFKEVFKNSDVHQASKAGCIVSIKSSESTRESCKEFNDLIFSNVLPNNNYDLVVYVAGVSPGKYWKETERFLKEHHINYIVFGYRPTLKKMPSEIVTRYGRLDGLQEKITQESRRPNDQLWSNVLPDLNFFSVIQSICPINENCVWYRNTMMTYRDKSHFTSEGSKVVAENFKQWAKKYKGIDL